MPTYQDLPSLQASTRVLSLWNGSSNNAEPAGWTDPSFDDSAWSLSSIPTVLSPGDLPSGVETVAPWTTPPNVQARMLYRMHVAPDLAMAPYLLEQFTPASSLQSIWVNGFEMLGSGIVAILDPAFVTFTSDTVIAGAFGDATFRWTSTSEGWQAFRLTFYTPDAGGQPYAWGTVTSTVNDKGFLGTGDTSTHLTPTLVDMTNLPASAVKIVSNGKTTLYLTNTGALYGSGDNGSGLLCTGSTDSSVHATPAVLAVGHVWPFADMSIGDDCAMAVERNGDVRMWGPNTHGSMGQGNTTAHSSSILARRVGERVRIGTDQNKYISAGRTFAVVRGPGPGICVAAGDNTYGQLGQSTSGGNVTSWSTVGLVGLGDRVVEQISAGDDQCLFVAQNPSSPDFNDLYGCGRAEYGSLGWDLYSVGSGANKIVNTPTISASGIGNVQSARQAGPMSFLTDPSDPPNVVALGDGVPYGGAGDDSDGFGAIVYGTTSTDRSEQVFQHFTGPFGPLDAPTASRVLAEISGGSNNAYASGDSKAVFGAISVRTGIFDGTFHDEPHPKLLSWGWGGAGQQGSGTDATTNLTADNRCGLSDVIAATVCAAGMFAITTAVVTVRRRSFAFAAVIG